ncbi:MAG: GNAT family N-acetyltransferase [Thermogutta sp.]
MSLSVVLHTDWETLVPWSDRWDHWAGGNPFRTWTWLTTWWSVYRSIYRRSHLYVLSIQSAEEPLGFAPLFATWHPLWGRSIRFLGSGEICGDDLGWIAPEDFQEQMGRAVANSLHRKLVQLAPLGACPGHGRKETMRYVACDHLDLDGVTARNRGMQAFIRGLRQLGWFMDVQSIEHSWQISLPATWTEYLQERLGRSMRRKARKLNDQFLASGIVNVHTTGENQPWEKAWRHLVNLHQARRHHLGKAGAFDSASFHCFHRTVLGRLISEDKARIVWLECQGQPIAAEYLLLSDGVVRAYQCGMNPDFAELSPGFLANLVVIRQAIAEKRTTFDFLRGDEPYKSQWGAQPVSMLRIRAVPPRPMAQVTFALWRTARACRNKLRNKKSGGYGKIPPRGSPDTDGVSQPFAVTTDTLPCLIFD